MEKKYILILEVDDELPDIYEKLQKTKNKKVDIFVPASSLLLKSSINLKILKRKAKSLEKDITIITKNKRNVHLIERVGLKAKQENVDVPTSSIKKTVPNKKTAENKNWFYNIWKKLEIKKE